MLLAFLAMGSITGFAQKAERQNIRKGNKLYEQEKFTEAEIDYRKSQEVNPNSPQAAFNLGNALYKQQKFEDAMKQYGIAAQNAQNQGVVGEAFHNTGNIFMSQKDYGKAIDAYKQALRLNPKDNETRYNLALAQKLLQDQQNQQQDQNQEQQQDQQNQDQQDQQKQDQKQDQQDQKDQQKDQQNQDQKNQDQQQEQQQQPQQSDKISKEVAEQILNALNQDEKDVQEKVQKAQMQQMQRKKTDKDW